MLDCIHANIGLGVQEHFLLRKRALRGALRDAQESSGNGSGVGGWTNDMNTQFTLEELWLGYKYMEKYSVLVRNANLYNEI